MGNIDLDDDGHIDEFEKKQHILTLGRSFFISIFAIIALILLQIFNKIDDVTYAVVGIIGLYLGRSATEDFSNKAKMRGREQ